MAPAPQPVLPTDGMQLSMNGTSQTFCPPCPAMIARAGRVRAVGVAPAELEAAGEARLLTDADQPGLAVVGLSPQPFGIGPSSSASTPFGNSSADGGLQVSAPDRVDRALLAAPATALADGSHSPGPGMQLGRGSKQGRRERRCRPSVHPSARRRRPAGCRCRRRDSSSTSARVSHLKPSGQAFARPRQVALEPAVRDVGLVAGELRRAPASKQQRRGDERDRAKSTAARVPWRLELQSRAAADQARAKSTASATGAPPASRAFPSVRTTSRP